MVSWGNWENSGGNGMRVGLEAHTEPVGHAEGACTITVEYWTENEHNYSDPQALNLGGAIGGSISFTNNQGSAATKRGERTYTYNYGANEYGSSPGSRTFSANLTGAYNGVTPSKSITVAIPGRPIGAPTSPTQLSLSRVSDGATKLSWNNRDTAGEPYRNLVIEREVDNGSWNRVASPDGGQSYTDSGVNPNHQYRYRIKAVNNAGESGYDTSGYLWTSPDAPTNCLRTPSGADQVVSWTNRAGYNEYETLVWHAADGVWDVSPLAYRANGVTSYTHVAPSAAIKHKYRVEHATTSGKRLSSAYSNITTESGGTATAPNAPTNLAPDGDLVLDPSQPITLSWNHNATDASAQASYQIQWRLLGDATWTTLSLATTGVTQHTFPANTFSHTQNIEWQVMTWGAAATGSPWSASATFVLQDAVLKKYPLYLDITSGRVEALSTMLPDEEEEEVRTDSHIPAHAHASKVAGSHTFDDGLWETLSFDTLLSQNGSTAVNIQATVTPGSVFTVGETGVYDVSASLAFENNVNFRRVMRMLVNDVSTIQQETAPYDFAAGAGQIAVMLTGTVKLNAGDLVKFEGYQNSGSNLAASVRTDMYWARVTKVDVSRYPDEKRDVPDTTYYRARADLHRRVPEDALLVDGTIPGWITDRIVTRAGLGRRPLRWVTVAQDGTGDYTTLTAAAAAITDSSARNPIGVLVRRGYYYEKSIHQKDGIWWVGVDREGVQVVGELPESSTDAETDPTSTFDFDFGGAIMNMTVTAKNMRYVVHCDAKANHVNGKILVLNCHLEHYGNDEMRAWRTANPGSGMLASSVWVNARAWGFGSSSGQEVTIEDCAMFGTDPFTVHDFDDWDRMSRTTIINTLLSATADTAVLSLSNLGAGFPSVISLRGCAITANHMAVSDSSFRSKLPANLVADSNDHSLTIAGGTHEPLGLQPTITARALKIQSAATTAPSTVAVSGTAAPYIFGVTRARVGGAGLPGYLYGNWDISGRLTGNFGIDVVDNTLGRRLGNCVTTPKTLTVVVNGGAAININFTTNLTNATNATILGTINTALGAAATASEYNVVAEEWFPELLNDTITGVHKGTVGIGRFHAVKRSGRGIDLFGTGDPVTSFLGVSLDRVQPGKLGRILTRGRLQSITTGGMQQQIPGITTAITVGQSIYHSDVTAGRFATSGTRLAMTGITAGWAEFRGTR